METTHLSDHVNWLREMLLYLLGVVTQFRHNIPYRKEWASVSKLAVSSSLASTSITHTLRNSVRDVKAYTSHCHMHGGSSMK